jgi:hypothetical protein
MANAQRMPDGDTVVDEPEPLMLTRAVEPEYAWTPIFSKSTVIMQGGDDKIERNYDESNRGVEVNLTNPIQECTQVAIDKTLIDVIGVS